MSFAGTTATFTSVAPLASGTTYTATISTAVKDLAGNALAASHTWTFSTRTAARALQKVAGDEQLALPGEDARAPLRVRALGANGAPLPAVTIHWAVTEGEATLDPAQSTTDASGETETQVTIGATIGRVVVSATAQGVAPVTFVLRSLPPCGGGAGQEQLLSFPEITLGTTLTGRLQSLDCDFGDGRLNDFYRFTVAAQQAVTVSVRAPSFDPLVKYFGSAADFRERGGMYDTVNSSREAVMKLIVAPGTYLVAATAFAAGIAGPYQLSMVAASESADQCGRADRGYAWLMPGVTTAQTLAASDCVVSPGPFHEDVFLIVLWPGEHVTLTQSSTQFEPRLRLLDPTGAQLAVANGSTSGTATIEFTSNQSPQYYVLRASSVLAQQSGAYTLTVAYPPGATASAAAAPTAQSPSLSGHVHRQDGVRETTARPRR